MPWTTEIDPARRVVYTRVSGPLTCEDAVAHRDTLRADPTFDHTFSHVLDLRAVDRISLSTTEIIGLASGSLFGAPARQIIVAPGDEMFGVARMYHAYRHQHANHEDIIVCRSLTDACARLGIDRLPGSASA